MLVSEIKKAVEKYDKKEMTGLVIELYKIIPKAKKEQNNIDDLILDFKKKEKKKDEKISFPELVKEVNYFLECVEAGYYAEPNRVITKVERSKWRFKAKKYFKELNSYEATTSEGMISTDLLIKMFKLLSYGSVSLLFSNWETFRALGVSQEDYLYIILKRIFANGYSEENIKLSVELLEVDKDPYGCNNSLIRAYVDSLQERQAKNTSIVIIKQKVLDLKEQLKSLGKSDRKTFATKEDINFFTEIVFFLELALGENEEAINYFLDNEIKINKEIQLFVLLNHLKREELFEDWIRVYEEHKVDYRESLREDYKEVKEKIG